MKDQILFGRLGNKTNDIKYFKEYLPLDIKNIVEPFGGTFSISRIIYNDDKYNIFVNDSDTDLYEIYKNPQEYSDYCIKMNNYAIKNKTLKNGMKVDYKHFIKEIEEHKMNINESFYNIWVGNNVIMGTNIKPKKEINHKKCLDFMKNINFSNDDYLNCIEKHRKNKDTFIFLDPPYLFSNNIQYKEQGEKSDTTEIIYKIYELMKDKKTKAKIMFIINDLKILRWLFKDFIKGEYKKIYQIGKRKDNHLIICNY